MWNINALIIAKILINKCHKLDRKITNLKLQKLLYFAQGHYMQENKGTPLFQDDFQAWAHGPVVPAVYREFKEYMWFNLPKQEISEASDSFNDFLDRLLGYYGSSTGKELEITSHDEKTWQDSRIGLREYEPSYNVISKEAIREYYLYSEKVVLNALV